jgi:hypothetical protein
MPASGTNSRQATSETGQRHRGRECPGMALSARAGPPKMAPEPELSAVGPEPAANVLRMPKGQCLEVEASGAGSAVAVVRSAEDTRRGAPFAAAPSRWRASGCSSGPRRRNAAPVLAGGPGRAAPFSVGGVRRGSPRPRRGGRGPARRGGRRRCGPHPRRWRRRGSGCASGPPRPRPRAERRG